MFQNVLENSNKIHKIVELRLISKMFPRNTLVMLRRDCRQTQN